MRLSCSESLASISELLPLSLLTLGGDLNRHHQTDSDLLFSFFIAFGNESGRSAHFVADADNHYVNLFVEQVGMTVKMGSDSAYRLEAYRKSWSGNRSPKALN